MVSLNNKQKKKQNNNNTNLRFTHNYAELKDLRERKATQPLIKCARIRQQKQLTALQQRPCCSNKCSVNIYMEVIHTYGDNMCVRGLQQDQC